MADHESAVLRRPPRWAGRALLLTATGAGLWLLGSAGSSASAAELAPQPVPAAALVGALLSPVDEVTAPVVSPVLSPVVDEVVAPVVAEVVVPVAAPVVDAVVVPVVEAVAPVVDSVVPVVDAVVVPAVQQ